MQTIITEHWFVQKVEKLKMVSKMAAFLKEN